jgi:hypothetical protein
MKYDNYFKEIICQNKMENYEINLTLDGKKFLFNLNPQIDVAGRINLGMALSGISKERKRKGVLEAKTLDGKEFEDWEKVGTFSEEFFDYVHEDMGECDLYLNLKNVRIKVKQFCFYDGSGKDEAEIQTKKHWYNRWKTESAKEVSITR